MFEITFEIYQELYFERQQLNEVCKVPNPARARKGTTAQALWFCIGQDNDDDVS